MTLRRLSESFPVTVSALCFSVEFEPSRASPTLLASSLHSSRWQVWLWKQQVSVRAMSFRGVNSGFTSASQNVFSGRNEFDVSGINTPLGAASKVVELWNVLADAFRKRLNQPCVQQAMGCDSFGLKGHRAIAATIQGSCPQPAASRGVNDDLREDAPDVLRLKIWDGEILLFSHARVLLERVREWLGLRWCSSTVAARPLYPDEARP